MSDDNGIVDDNTSESHGDSVTIQAFKAFQNPRDKHIFNGLA